MNQKRRKLDYELCSEISKKYSSLSKFQKEDGGVFNKIKKEKWLELIEHIPDEYKRREMEIDESIEYEPKDYYLNYSIKDLEGEKWIDVKGFEDFYQVSNLGRVKSKTRKVGIFRDKPETIKRGYLNKKGYVKVQLNSKEKRNNYFVHRLVIRHFIGESKLEVNHKNMIKTDNTLENLEYVTGSQNVQHAAKMTNRIWYHAMGENSHHARRIIGIDINTKEIKYDVGYIRGIKKYFPEDQAKKMKYYLKNKKIFAGCYWIYYNDYKEGRFDFNEFSVVDKSKSRNSIKN